MAQNLESLSKADLVARLQELQSLLGDETDQVRLKEDVLTHQAELRAQGEQLLHAHTLLEQSREDYAELYDFAPLAYLTLNRHGVITAINLTGCAFLELERARLLNVPFSRFLVSEDRPQLQRYLQECLSSSLSVFGEFTLRAALGKEVPVQLTSKRVYKEGAGPAVIRMAITDLTTRKRAEAQIRKSHEELERRVVERTRELERLSQSLLEADRIKNEFLAMLGHELRNPLGPMRNALEVWRISEPQPADPSICQMRAIIDRQVVHMSRIIDDLLDVSRISRGKVVLHPQDLDLAALVENTVADAAGEIAAAGLSLSIETSREPLWVNGDPTRLAQALTNLLNNARKFTDPGGEITACVYAQDGQAYVSVRDNGIGVDAGMIRNVFEPFSQADQSLDRSRGGLGLGLSLVRGLIELHNGRVFANSSGLGKGSEFVFCLPLVAAPAEKPSPSTAPSASERPLRILVIDDGRDTVITMRALLRKLGHEVETASDGERGLEIAEQTCPDVVISDIGLPGIDGYEVARQIRQHPQLREKFLVAVTGYGQDEDRQRAAEAGFNEHLTKPIDLRDLRRFLSGVSPRASR